MDGQWGTEAGQRRWSDLSTRDQAEIDRSLYKGVGVSPECADLATDRAAALGAMVSPLAWTITALAAFAVIDAVLHSDDGLSAWVYPAVVLTFAAVAHVLCLRLRRARRTNTRPGRQSGVEPELHHVVELMRGSTRVQVALALVVVLVVLTAWWLG